jgi:hypothetical protein
MQQPFVNEDHFVARAAEVYTLALFGQIIHL